LNNSFKISWFININTSW